MKLFRTPNLARIVQLVGVLIAVAGLTGFWSTRDVERSTLTEEQVALVNPRGEDFHASFVVAGRDYDISTYASPCRWVGGNCVRDRVGDFQLGRRTDTILFVNLAGQELSVIAIPRDLWLPQWQTRINAMYGYQGPEGLKRSVEEIVGVPIDYYAIVSIDIFQDIVDALGGVEVNIPYPMRYQDAAAGLVIDFDEGPRHLTGEDAAKFVRYRNTLRGDVDRIDNVKRLAYALLDRVKELNVRAVGAIPALMDVFFEDVETNVSPSLVRRVLPGIGGLTIGQTATLPVYEVQLEDGTWVLSYDPGEVESFLASTVGGKAREFASAPEGTFLITNRSGLEGLGDVYRSRLVALGVPEEQIALRDASEDPTPTRLQVTAKSWSDADYYAGLLGTGKQQVDRLPAVDSRQAHIELVLGQDAAAMWSDSNEPLLAEHTLEMN